MKKNKKNDLTPFNMSAKPKRQNPAFLPLVWGGSWLLTRGNQLKLKQIGMDGIKPPYLLLSMHQGFMDYYVTPLSLFPRRASYISDMEGFANYGKWLYSQIGCVPTRRFVSDLALIRNIRHVVRENRDIVVVYPEARHSNVGTTSVFSASVGKLVKLLGLPVVVQKIKGSYLNQPIWDEAHSRGAPIEAVLEKILDPSDIENMDAAQLVEAVKEHFVYDEYKWQYEQKIRIDYPDRAAGLHKMLYLCPHCGAEYQMESSRHILQCGACKKEWEMSEYGRLSAKAGKTEFAHIPDWYTYQKEQVKREIEEQCYAVKTKVSVEALPNEHGFVKMGGGKLVHSQEGFRLWIETAGKELYFPAKAMCSVQTEYDYREKGDCLVLSTKECSYYLFRTDKQLEVTKMQLAAEVFYQQY